MLSELREGRFSPAEERELFHGICDIFTGLLHPEAGNDGLSEYADARCAAERFAALCGEMRLTEIYFIMNRAEEKRKWQKELQS